MKRDNRSKMDQTASIGGKSSKIQQSVDFYTKDTSHFPLLIALSSHMRRLVHFRSIVHRRRLGNKGSFGPIWIDSPSTRNTVETVYKVKQTTFTIAYSIIRQYVEQYSSVSLFVYIVSCCSFDHLSSTMVKFSIFPIFASNLCANKY